MQIVWPEAVLTPEGIRTDHGVVMDHGVIVDLIDRSRQSNAGRSLPGKVLIPGLVNAHSHAFQRAIRGRVQHMDRPDDDFWSWRNAMYGVVNALSPEDFQAVSRLAFLEMALAGVTAVGEFHYVHRDRNGAVYADPDELAHRVIAAATEVGIRICLLRVVYARNGVHSSLGRDQRRFRDDAPDEALAAIARLKKSDDPRVSVGLAPHSIRAVPYDWLQELSSADGVVHSHVAEQPKELEQCHAEYGQSPLAVMARAGLVTPDFTAVHLTWPGPGDLDLLAERGAGVCVCPTTELDLGDGFFPGAQWRGRTAVGSDSHARIDILEEARLVNGIARAHAGRRNVASARPARDVLRYATSDGASALGLQSGIRVGAPADLVAVDISGPSYVGQDALDALAFTASGRDVTDVWVGGRAIVVDGRHAATESIVTSAREALSGL